MGLRLPIALAALAGSLSAGHLLVVDAVDRLIHRQSVAWSETSDSRRLAGGGGRPALSGDDGAVPFTEVAAFDDDALSWSTPFSQYAEGVLVFDANGDGRLDVYLCQNGHNWTHPTDADGILQDRPRLQHSALYLNLGNLEGGVPRFVQAARLAAGNDAHVEAELLVENQLVPRRSVDERRGPGRHSHTAVAADFNGDGRLDLLVGNGLPGMLWSHPTTQRTLWPFVAPIGREARYSKQPLAALGLHLVHYRPRDNTHDRRRSARGWEHVGANSLFLNLGDADRDGLPEWRDASREAGIEGQRSTYSLAVADVDLDGDLDVYEGNAMDYDFWPGGARALAGAANQLYLNQLAESGELRFVERSAAYGVDGVFDDDLEVPVFYRLWKIPWLPEVYSVLAHRYVPYRPPFLEIAGQRSERAQISWATVFQDADGDGFPDLWVANDIGIMRLYRNRDGQRFTLADHAASSMTGNWMSFSPGDFDGDLEEDLFAGNLGGAIFGVTFPFPNLYDLFDPVMIDAMAAGVFGNGSHDTRHAILDGTDPNRRLPTRVQHSRVLPPDVSLPNNVRKFRTGERVAFDVDSLDPYEFSWGSTSFDVQNDGRLDLYYLGCLYGRGGGIAAVMGTGPGRLLINETRRPGTVRWRDLTAEHRVFNIHELRYDRLEEDGYVYRLAPAQNWGKRDVVYSFDRSSWMAQGVGIQEKVTHHDLIQTAENGRAAVAADVNGDGYADLLVRNSGGYDSRSSSARNLKVRRHGQVRAVPAPDANYPTLTEFAPGSVRLFLNRYRRNNWIKIRLLDDRPGRFNRHAIGARVVVNDRWLRVQRADTGGFVSNQFDDLLFGLEQQTAVSVTVHWPDRERSVDRWQLPGVARQTLVISKTRGVRAAPGPGGAPQPSLVIAREGDRDEGKRSGP